MNSALIIIDKAPYGHENALSGIYIAIASRDKGIQADILLMGEGVYAALKDQSSEKTIGYPSVGELSYSIFPEGNLFIHLASLTQRGIEYGDLVEIAELIDDKTLYNLSKSKNHIIKI
ncbi:sulfur reduction protein DsrE [Methanobacterium subterraneum]|jgi:tRNA 2-thiouridine synthesizing protein C|uniref:Sulfur reduction protein DsrE n=1 Tax=Methanobacterium subterraneum TaxID=59277 RepID=A0A2H4VT57_9EURY|nr:DsrE family protein [Methanobacterium subterraneum]AUB61210.1 sulfur reduction protein DsrE [Methanobacterium subterraneum]